MPITLTEVTTTGPYDWRWPDGYVEHYERRWDAFAEVDGRRFRVRHCIGSRFAYGRQRVRTVTWVDGSPMVEGVEADDYPESRSLLSILKRPNRTL